MIAQGTSASLFNRLRRHCALRAMLVFVAVLVSQDSLACVFDNAAQTVIAADSPVSALSASSSPTSDEAPGDVSCAQCVGCVYCGGCCSFAVTFRPADTLIAVAISRCERIGFATTASKTWTPPTLLRPPNNLA
jgi:hypothetical protein